MKDLVLVLGDQLSPGLPGLRQLQPGDADILMDEVTAETEYVWHHRKKIAFIFSAMRHFAAALEEEGACVDYVRLDGRGNTGSFTGEVDRAVKRHKPDRVVKIVW